MIDPEAPDFLDTPAHPGRARYLYRVRDGRQPSPVVSIVTPFCNATETFHETARSVLRQSFQPWEWLIVNDASSGPEALSILDRYRDCDPRIRVVDHTVTRGRSAARNTGVQAARSEYVYLIDDSDLIEPTAIEKCLWHLVSYPELAFASGWSVGFGAQQYLWSRGFEEHERFLESNLVTGRPLVRRSVYQRIGGYDETIRDGMEDRDFWLRAADRGLWGGTIPEYLEWHRRRPNHGDPWPSLDGGTRVHDFEKRLRARYPRLYEGGFAVMRRRPPSSYEATPAELPFGNPLEKPAGTRRVLMLLPWLVMGGADKFNLDLIAQLSRRDHEVTICTTLESDNPWLAHFARVTPDILNLPAFLRPSDIPRFLLYLIDSRAIDVVMISNSYLGYQLLPFLRSYRPHVAYVDYVHMEQELWKNGGYARAALGYQEVLDLTLVATKHLERWMVERGAEPARLQTVHTSVDAHQWSSAGVEVGMVRRTLGIPADVPVILYAGRICEQKQPRVFAEVIRRLAQEERVEFACVVAGDGPDLPLLRQLVTDHSLERYVSFAGAVKPDRMRELQAAADILFLPSQHEGLSLAVYESMAMRTVPVTADVGGQAELVTPDCGILVTPGAGEVDRYVAALTRLIAAPSLRAAMAVEGRRRVAEHFSLDRMVERVVESFGRAEKLAVTDPRGAVGRGLGRECATLAIEYTRLERELGKLGRSNSELAVSAETLSRRLSQLQGLLTSQVEGDEVKRLSAEQISRHIGVRKLLRALCHRVAFRASAARHPLTRRSGAEQPPA